MAVLLRAGGNPRDEEHGGVRCIRRRPLGVGEGTSTHVMELVKSKLKLIKHGLSGRLRGPGAARMQRERRKLGVGGEAEGGTGGEAGRAARLAQ